MNTPKAATTRDVQIQHEALGAVVRALMATLPPHQQRVFLTRMLDTCDSVERTGDLDTLACLNSLVALAQTEQRPGPGPSL